MRNGRLPLLLLGLLGLAIGAALAVILTSLGLQPPPAAIAALAAAGVALTAGYLVWRLIE